MQTEEDAERIRQLGAPAERVKVCGNVKYDVSRGSRIKDKGLGFSRENLGIGKNEELLICGSTHKGEEEILLEVYKELSQDFPNLRLLIAPRHIDRVGDIEKLCERFGFSSIKVSKIDTKYKIQNTKLG